MTESDSPLTIPECDLVNLVLSRTSAGACLRGSCRADGRRVSVRLLCVTSGLDRWWKEHVQDLLLVRQLRSERLLVPLGLYRAGPQVGLVLEWMQEGSLHTLLHETQLYPELPIPLRLRILLDVAEGLSHLHAIALPHLALRPTNVLLDTQYRAKVCDWGLQWTQSSGSAVSAGCMPYNRDLVYMSPELLQGKPPSLQADVYSFGMMLLQTLNRRLPSKDTCSLKIQQSHAICWPGTGTEPLDHALKHLIVQSCSNDPQSRPAAAECMLELRKALLTFDPEAPTRAVLQLMAYKIKKTESIMSAVQEKALLGCKDQQTTELKVDINNLEVYSCCKDTKSTFTKMGILNLVQKVTLTPHPPTAGVTGTTQQNPTRHMLCSDKHLITQHASEETASSVLQSFGRLRSQSVPEYQQQNETGRASFQQGSSPLPTPTLPMGFRHGRHNVPLCFLPGPSCCRILQERREAIVRGMTEGRLNNLLDVLRSRKALSQEEYELITAALTLAARTRSLLDTCLCLGEGVARLVAFTLGLVSTPTIHGPSRLSY